MANIKISRKSFEKDIGNLDEKMQNRIALFGTTLESFDDEEIELEIFPNRPDLLSYQGFKRGFLGFLGKDKGLRNYKINPPEKNYEVSVDKSVSEVWPYCVCAIVKGLRLDDAKIKEVIDIQEKITMTVGRKRKKLGLGVYPLDKIALPVSYVALEPDKIKFKPLEASREMTGLEILSRHPTGREYAHLLAGKSKFPIFVDSNKEVLSMPPIINSHETGKITEKTKDIFIECTGTDYKILKKSLNILVCALIDMGGKAYQMKLVGAIKDVTPDFTPEKNKVSVENVNKVLGLNLNEKQVKGCLERMGHNYSKGVAESGSWRTDLLHEVDLIEDVAIAYGYDNFEPEIPKISTIGEENYIETIKRKLSDILVGLGFLEISNYHLTKEKDQFLKMGIAERDVKGAIEVMDSKTEYNLVRNDLSHYAMKILSENVDVEYPQKIFEMGRIFNLNNDLIEESESLSIAASPSNFTELKQILEYLSRMVGVKLEVKEANKVPLHFIDGRCAEVLLDGVVIGYFGEIHPKILKNFRIRMPVALLEISLEGIFRKLE